jgi:uncharacterized protein (DUF2461 family)
MIKQTSLKFLTELKNNNSKEWFEQNKVLYECSYKYYKGNEITKNTIKGRIHKHKEYHNNYIQYCIAIM